MSKKLKRLFSKENWVKFVDVMGTIGFYYIVLYAILKILGIIHSPVELDNALIFSAVWLAGKYMNKIENIEKAVEEHSGILKDHLKEMSQISIKLGRHDFEIIEVKSILSSHLDRH